MANKFFLTRNAASHQGPENFHFDTNLPRTLSIQEGRELRDLLTSLLDEPKKPEPVLPSAEEADEQKKEQVSSKKAASWGTPKTAK